MRFKQLDMDVTSLISYIYEMFYSNAFFLKKNGTNTLRWDNVYYYYHHYKDSDHY